MIAMIDGAAIRTELDRLGKSQAALARFIRAEPSDISRALGGRPVGPELLFRIALGLSQLARGHTVESSQAGRYVFTKSHRAALSQAARNRHQRDRARTAARKGGASR